MNVGFLIVCAFYTISSFDWATDGHRIFNSLFADSSFPTALRAQLAKHAFAVLFVHGLALITCLALVWLTERSIPSARKSRTAVTSVWVLAISSSIVLANAMQYPWSLMGQPLHGIASQRLGPWRVGELFLVALGTSVTALAVLALLRAPIGKSKVARHAPWALTFIFVAAFAATIINADGLRNSRTEPDPNRPHVVLIGLDSLRTDVLDDPELARNLNAAVVRGFVFRDTLTPLARTYPAWVSILSGKSPRTSGARFNLMPRDAVDPSPSLPQYLQTQGYETIFATDEVRFSNLDESYGFDRLITPPMGAADFLIGYLSDFPLVNLITNLPISKWLFPYTYGNRAAAATYRADTFTERLRNELTFERPTFLAVHLTAAHWPYFLADSPLDSLALGEPEMNEPLYRHAVRRLDSMVVSILSILRERGVLENAIVVFLSDHGEGFCTPEDLGDNFHGQFATDQRCGHGTSVLSPAQHRVLLSFAGYGEWDKKIPRGESTFPASLLDITPTLLDILGLPLTEKADGISLRPILFGEADDDLRSRFRFIETGLSSSLLSKGQLEPDRIAAASAVYYWVRDDNARLELRTDRLDELVRTKERAVIADQWLLAALPRGPDSVRYVLANRKTGLARQVDWPPARDTVEYALGQALHKHFRGEIEPPQG